MSEIERPLIKRLGWMADAVVHAKTGPGGRFFTRECADEIALLLREAEKALLEARQASDAVDPHVRITDARPRA